MLRRIVFTFAVFLTLPAVASNWVVIKDEPDPFDSAAATFIAGTSEGGRQLAARCTEGHLTFAVTLDPGTVSRSDEINFLIVADKKQPISAPGYVLSATMFDAWVQFGDEAIFDYLHGAKKFYLRASFGSQRVTFGFTGGHSFDGILDRALKACGILTPDEERRRLDALTSDTSAATKAGNERDCSRETSCTVQFECLRNQKALGDNPNEDGYIGWCTQQLGMLY